MNLTRRLSVSIDDQTLSVIEGDCCLRVFKISTATKGMGFTPDSYRTPTGKFKIAGKIGDALPSGTIFKSRVACGIWQQEMVCDHDLILTRILLLDGLEPENANSHARHIYIHGTNQEAKLGQPASHGCIRLGNREMIELYEMVEEGLDVLIQPATQCRGKLFFIDCDSTLCAVEGIDELARARGDEVFQDVVALTNAAMNGEIPIQEVFSRRMEMIRPDYTLCDQVAELYLATIVPGAVEMIQAVKAAGWLPVILSGGFSPLIKPLAQRLGISHVEAVPLYFHDDGSYQGYGDTYPTTRNLGKNTVIREWKQALLPERVVMMGDGVSDLETKPDVDLFIGFGGVVSRPKVENGCDHWLTQMHEAVDLLDIMSQAEVNKARV
jgi:HAD superfamily phosphoserine phosphatase-like hydrolase